MQPSQLSSLTGTVTVRTPIRSANARPAYASLSVAFSLLPDAYQGDLCITDRVLPGGHGLTPPHRAASEMRGDQ